MDLIYQMGARKGRTMELETKIDLVMTIFQIAVTIVIIFAALDYIDRIELLEEQVELLIERGR